MTATVVKPEVFFGIDAADARQVVTQIVAGESPKPAQGMTSDTLLKRVAEWLKAGFRVHCVYEAGPTGFALARQLIALGAARLVVRARQLDASLKNSFGRTRRDRCRRSLWRLVRPRSSTATNRVRSLLLLHRGTLREAFQR